MINTQDRLQAGQAYLTLTIVDREGVFMASLNEMPADVLEGASGSPTATQFLAYQLSTIYVIEKYLEDPRVEEALRGILKIGDGNNFADDEDEDEFNFDLGSSFGEEDETDQLANYDLSIRMIYILHRIMEIHAKSNLSPFTDEIYEGRKHYSLEEIKRRLEETVAFLETVWPSEIMSSVMDRGIYDYDTATAFMTSPFYMEMMRAQGKVNPKLDKRRVGSIPYGQFQSTAPIQMAISNQMSYLSPIQAVLSGIDHIVFSTRNLPPAESRRYGDLKERLIKSIKSLDNFIKDNNI